MKWAPDGYGCNDAPTENILTEAERIVYGDMERTYGTPAKNLNQIARLWSAYLDTEITAHEVCDMMMLLKLARLQNNPEHRDSLVDIAGYAALKERIQER